MGIYKIAPTHLVMIALFLMTCSGCVSHGWVRNSFSYPRNAGPDKAQYWINIVAVSASGRRPKGIEQDIQITIASHDRELMRRQYRLTGGPLAYSVAWSKAEDVEVVFFDLPGGVTIYDKRAKQLVPRTIMIVRYSMDPETGAFAEAPLTWEQIEMRGEIK